MIAFLFGTDSEGLRSLLVPFVTLGIAFLIGVGLYGIRRITAYDVRDASAWLALLPLMVALPTLLIDNEVARAICLVGMLVFLKDTGWGMIAVVCGFLCGIGYPGYGILLAAGCIILLLIRYEAKKRTVAPPVYRLDITVPEDLRIPGVFEDAMREYTQAFAQTGLRTDEMGMFFETTYVVTLKDGADPKAFINALRSLNGNLSVSLTISDTEPGRMRMSA